MPDISQYTRQALLNAFLGKTSAFGALASRPTIYIGLSSTTPTSSGGNVTEPSGGGYARVATAPTDWGTASAADPSEATNAAKIDFGTASGTWVSGANLTHAVAYDAATDGNFLGSGALAVAKPVFDGDPAEIPIGEAKIRFA